ncbi:MAG: tetratricopeptide repeat protein, partial [Planctomycetes bacterium]|nr:tetratricopeptide repeat protein [Planctomycetota bacterium]
AYMKWLRLRVVCFALLLALAPAGVLQAQVTVKLAAEPAGALQTATEKNFYLVMPKRFFRAKGETAFTTPYIAELYYTTDGGGTWTSWGLFKDLNKPLEFTADQEGRYGFFVTLVDRKGNHDFIPESGTGAQAMVLVDWTAPEIEILAPGGGEVVGGADTLEIKWRAEDLFLADLPITIEYSIDSGTTWQPLAARQENTGSFSWKPPDSFEGRILIRLSAADEVGHTASAMVASPILIDTTPPKATLEGPTLAATDKVTLEAAGDDGDGSGLLEWRLWVSHDNGVSWSPAGNTAAGEPIVFSAPSGRYGLFASAVDRAGNTSAIPRSGDAPQTFLQIDTKVPLVRLKTLKMGGSVRGGSRIPIQWEAVAPKLAPKPVAIYLSPDGGNSWTIVAADLPNSGNLFWDVPSINSSNCCLKVTLRDASGAVGEAQSAKPFTIDSIPPTSAVGIAPSDLLQPIGDLSQVLRPLGKAETETPQDLQGDSEEPAKPGRQQEVQPRPQTPRPPAGEVTSGTMPEPTQPPSAPWTTPREEPYAGTPGPDASAEDVLKAAFAAYKCGRLNIAKDYFLRAARLAPDDPRPHAALGKVYMMLAGFAYSSKKEAFEAALYEFEKALSLSGEDADVLNDMGFALLQTKRYEDAVKALRRATAAGSKPVYWYNLGLALYRQGQSNEALEAFLKAAALDPQMKEVSFFIGRMYSDLGQWEKAKEYWRKAADGYGPEDRLGKMALAGLQKAREALGEVTPEPQKVPLKEKLDRIR